MNKYALMLVAAGLIAAAPAYYAFQAQAEENQPAGQAAAPTQDDQFSANGQPSDEAAAAADQTAPAAGTPDAQGLNE